MRCLTNMPLCKKSRAKILWDVKRITSFIEKKSPILALKVLPQISIPPLKPTLSVVSVQTTNVLPHPDPILSISRNTLVDIPPSPNLTYQPGQTIGSLCYSRTTPTNGQPNLHTRPPPFGKPTSPFAVPFANIPTPTRPPQSVDMKTLKSLWWPCPLLL